MTSPGTNKKDASAMVHAALTRSGEGERRRFNPESNGGSDEAANTDQKRYSARPAAPERNSGVRRGEGFHQGTRRWENRAATVTTSTGARLRASTSAGDVAPPPASAGGALRSGMTGGSRAPSKRAPSAASNLRCWRRVDHHNCAGEEGCGVATPPRRN